MNTFYFFYFEVINNPQLSVLYFDGY